MRTKLLVLLIVAAFIATVPGFGEVPKALAWNFTTSARTVCTDDNKVAVEVTVQSSERRPMELWYQGSKIADVPAYEKGTGTVPLEEHSTPDGTLYLFLKWQGEAEDHPFSVNFDAKDCTPPPSPAEPWCALEIKKEEGPGYNAIVYVEVHNTFDRWYEFVFPDNQVPFGVHKNEGRKEAPHWFPPGSWTLHLEVDGPGGAGFCEASVTFIEPEDPDKPEPPAAWQTQPAVCRLYGVSHPVGSIQPWVRVDNGHHLGDLPVQQDQASVYVDLVFGRSEIQGFDPGQYTLGGAVFTVTVDNCYFPSVEPVRFETGYPTLFLYDQRQAGSGRFEIPDWGFRMPIVGIEPVNGQLNPYGGQAGRYQNALLIHQFDAPSLPYLRVDQKVMVDGIEYRVAWISGAMEKSQTWDFVRSNPERMFLVTCTSDWKKNIIIEIAPIVVGPSAESEGVSAHVNIDGRRLNIRSGPGQDQAVIGSLPNGAELTVLDTEGKWTYVQTPEGSQGWVAGWLLK